jgi:hypothetical protein
MASPTSTSRPAADKGWISRTYGSVWRQTAAAALARTGGDAVAAGGAATAAAPPGDERLGRLASLLRERFSSAAASVAAAAARSSSSSAPSPRPTHLVLMVNGLTGAPSNWDYIVKQFHKKMPKEVVDDMLLYP